VSDDDATITPYRNGPYIVRGRFTVMDQDGNPIETHRKTIALCRCGKSQIRPFCDGTHKLIGFKAAGKDERLPDTDPPPHRIT
jgi:CDGSH-type Zn-finger protein